MEKKELLAFLNDKIAKNNMLETLQIVFTDINGKELTAKMPVNKSVHQPMGLLHGGATAALAESVGSTASHIFVDIETQEIRSKN